MYLILNHQAMDVSKYEWYDHIFWLFVSHRPMPIFFNLRCKCFATLLARLHNVNCLYFTIVVDSWCTNFLYGTYLCIYYLDITGVSNYSPKCTENIFGFYFRNLVYFIEEFPSCPRFFSPNLASIQIFTNILEANIQ